MPLRAAPLLVQGHPISHFVIEYFSRRHIGDRACARFFQCKPLSKG